jgi:YD repeat-containing protein
MSRGFVGVLLLLIAFGIPLAAQDNLERRINYGEVRSAYFETENSHQWEFIGDAGDIIEIDAIRIAGQFVPDISVFAPNGTEVLGDYRYLSLAADGLYLVQINEGEDENTSLLLENEYSLSLRQVGKQRSNIEDGLSPLPILEAFPDFFTGVGADEASLGIQLYGNPQLSVITPTNSRRMTVLTANRTVSIFTSNPIARGINAIALQDFAVAIRSVTGAIFYTDQDVLTLETLSGITTITLANGQSLITDFYRIQSIQAVNNLFQVVFETGQVFLGSGQSFEFLRRGGILGEGPNAEAVNLIRVDGAEIETDLQAWTTLAMMAEDLRVYYDEMRYLGESHDVSLFSDNGRLQITDGSLNVDVEPFGIADIVARGGNLIVQAIDGRELSQSLDNMRELLISNRILRFYLNDGSSRLLLTDGTLIETPNSIPADNLALANQANFRPRHFNNLGANPYDYHPAPDFDFALLPVNRVTGNFFYQIEDFSDNREELSLAWTRTYNSLAPAQDNPSYVSSLSMGNGWRHSYQLELDILYAPLGEVWLNLPDGSRHIFSRQEAVFRSQSLLSWTIQEHEDATWQVFDSEGGVYDFDGAGRLLSIQKGSLSLRFSPVPQEYLGQYAGGFFVSNDYGQRIEVYADENGLIREVRDVLNRSIYYQYEGEQLIGVDYSHNDEVVSYTYTDAYITAIFENQNPYHRELRLQYDEFGRVVSFQKGSQNDLNLQQSFVYAAGSTTEIEHLSEGERQHVYTYDDAFRLVRYDSPRPNWSYRWNFSSQTGRLIEVTLPELAILRYQYDEFGYMTSFTDPLFGSGAGSYAFHYASPDERIRLLSAVDIPSVSNYLRLQYDAENRLSLVNRAGSVTSYSYDEMGRILSINQPESRVVYSYDDFGYISRIEEGNGARISQLQHDIVGHLLSKTDGRGTVTNYLWSSSHERVDKVIVGDWTYDYAYDEFGNLISYSFNGQEIRYSYDSLNRLISEEETIGAIPYRYSYSYDEIGNLVSITKPDGSSEAFSYDVLNMLESYTDSKGLVTLYAVDLNIESSRKNYTVTYPSGEIRRYSYDPLGRVRQVVSFDRAGDQFLNYYLSYNALGYLTSIEESHVPGGRILSLEYDALGNPSSATLNNVATTEFSYNSAGQLLSEIDPEGRISRYSYDSLGNLISQTLPDGSILNYSYDENGNRTSFIEAGGAEWAYTYDAHNRLTAIIDPKGNFTSYEYDTLGNLSAIVNPNGTRMSMSYDEGSRLIELTDLSGNLSRYSYDLRDNITRVEQAGGLNSDFFYDAADNLVAFTQSGGRETLYGRDNEGRIVSITDSLGHSSFFAYNTIGSIGRITDPLGNETTYRWSASGRIVGYGNARGASYEYAGDSIGRLTSITDKVSEQTTALRTFIEYDDAGYITALRFGTSVTINSNQAIVYRYTYTPNGQLASYLPPEASSPYRYDLLGNITEIRRATATDVERVERYEYDSLGNLVRYTAADGVINDFVYDSAMNLTGRTETGIGGDTRSYLYAYDAYGRMTRSVDPLGEETSYRYDLYGNLIVVERGAFSSRYEYDEANNLRRVQAPAGQISLMSYNALGQRVRYTDGENNAWSYSYDDAGNLSLVTDPLGNNTSYSYDFNNRLVSVLYPNDARAEIVYDNQGHPSILRLPNNQTITTQFDRVGNLSSVQYSSDSIVRYERDGLGRIIAQTNADGQAIRYDYDAHNNLISIESPESRQSRRYDSAGRLTQVSEGAEVIRYTYNAFGYLAQYRSPDVTVNYVYDEVGNLLSRDAGEYGRIDYEYDELYRPSRIRLGAEWIELEYNENAWRTRLLRSDGIETRYVYDNNGRVRNILHLNAAGERLDGFAYEYDAVGNILRVTRTDNSSVLYSYDESQKLINERWLSSDNQVRYSVSYTYDAAGNRSEETSRIGQANAQRTIFVYNNQNQLIEEIPNAEFTIEDRLAMPLIAGLVFAVPAFGVLKKRRRYLPLALLIIPLGIPFFQLGSSVSSRYSYDVNGNLITIDDASGSRSFAYDSFQRLVSITGDNLALEIDYDALGRVSQVTENELVYEFIYDHFGLIAIESNGARTLYFTALDESFLLETADGSLWPLRDALGSPRRYATPEGLLIDEAVNLTNFGEVISVSEMPSTVDSPQITFDDALYLPAAEIYIQDGRAYDPRLGRHLQRPELPDYVFVPMNLLEATLTGLNPTVPHVDPRDFVPLPSTDEPILFANVHSAQAAETRRLLEVARIAYQEMNEPNILSQFALGRLSLPIMSEPLLPSLAVREELLREDFTALLREIPLYPPLLEELPMLLNFAETQP